MSLDAESDKISDRGEIEINLLGMHLSSVKFNYVYSSDYERAKCTAEGILRHSKVSPNIPVQLETRLREVNFGIFEKTEYKKSFEYLKTLKEPPQEWYFPEGESFPQAGKRILDFLREISERHLNERMNDMQPSTINVLVVSHSGAIMGFLHVLQQSGHEVIGWNPKELKFMRNASFMKFEIKRKVGTNDESQLQFSFLEKYYSKHLDCINEGTGSHNVNPVAKFARNSDFGGKYVGCVQQ